VVLSNGSDIDGKSPIFETQRPSYVVNWKQDI